MRLRFQTERSACIALKRDIRVSDSEQQIMDICQEIIDNNVKKGWEEI